MGFHLMAAMLRRSMEIIATRNASLAADLREALKQHNIKDSSPSKDAPLSEAAAVADAEEDADEADDDDMDDETEEEKGVSHGPCAGILGCRHRLLSTL